MSLSELGTPLDVYQDIDGERYRVGQSFLRQPLLGENVEAFEDRVERLAGRLRTSGLEGKVTTRHAVGDIYRISFIDVIHDPVPAPNRRTRKRGRRGGSRNP